MLIPSQAKLYGRENMYVYKVTNMVNGKVYVGRTKDYAERVKYHKTRYVAKKEYNKPLYVAMRKYGVETFKFDIIASGLDDDESNKLETKMIKDLHSLVGENGYNVSPGDNYYRVRGTDVNTNILTEEEAQDIVNRRISGERSRDVYKDYKDKLTVSGFQQIWSGKNWRHLKGQENLEMVKGNARFSLKEVREIKTLLKNYSVSEVAKLYGVTYHTIYNIKAGISYASIAV